MMERGKSAKARSDLGLRRSIHILILIAVIGGVITTSGCQTDDRNAVSQRHTSTEPRDTRAHASAKSQRSGRRSHRRQHSGGATSMLKAITIRAESPDAGYVRQSFGGWVSIAGCNTRQRVLEQESRRRSAGRCGANGSWYSPYDGKRHRKPSTLDIDHVVPLEQAFVSGADRWTADTRRRFANDTDYRNSLIAVTASVNRQKGSKDPAEWMPPRAAFRCRYVGMWIAVKYRWRLTADRAEAAVLRRYVKRCGRKAKVRKPRLAIVRRMKHGSRSTGERRAKRERSHHRTGRRKGGGKLDPRFATCREAIANGYGSYHEGRDREFEWYRDADSDGEVCER